MTKGDMIPKGRRATKAFHGTDYDFEGAVLPRGVTKNAHFAISGEDDTYFLPADGPPETVKANEKGAWGWSSNVNGAPNQSRQRVHVTRPIGQQHIDQNLNWGAHIRDMDQQTLKSTAAVAPAQVITDTIWGPPATLPGSHVNQTLPHINWNQFGGPNWTTHVPASHGYPAQEVAQYAPGDLEGIEQTRFWAPMGAQNTPPRPAPPPQLPGQGTLDLG